jgi:hypothetical protein
MGICNVGSSQHFHNGRIDSSHTCYIWNSYDLLPDDIVPVQNSSIGRSANAALRATSARGHHIMHKAGFCHLDIKPSIIFLFKEDYFLGYCDAATKTGGEIRERTVSYYPRDALFIAEERTDMLVFWSSIHAGATLLFTVVISRRWEEGSIAIIILSC